MNREEFITELSEYTDNSKYTGIEIEVHFGEPNARKDFNFDYDMKKKLFTLVGVYYKDDYRDCELVGTELTLEDLADFIDADDYIETMIWAGEKGAHNLGYRGMIK